MPTAQHALLRILRHVSDVAFEFAGRTDIDERLARFTLGERFVGKGADFLVEALIRHRVMSRGELWDFPGHWASVRFPFVAATVEDLYLFMAKQTECPERVAGPPVRLVAVKNAGRVGRDAVAAAQL